MEVDSSNVIGSSSSSSSLLKKSEYYCGRDQLFRRDHMAITQPVVNGLIVDWDGVENVFDYAFTKHLRVNPLDHPLMLSEPTFQPQKDREKMVELMFEKFNTPALFLCKSAVLTAFSAGRSSACIVESGAGHTTVSSVHDGYVINKGIKRTKFAGLKLDEILEKTLNQQFTPAVSKLSCIIYIVYLYKSFMFEIVCLFESSLTSFILIVFSFGFLVSLVKKC